MYPGPNLEMLEAQARVCTGPHQSRPLGRGKDGPRPERVLQLVFQSLSGELPVGEAVSPAQMGAFFAAMNIRRRYGEKTGWSAAEHAAFSVGDIEQLPEVLRFLLGRAQGFVGETGEKATVKALRTVLRGGHLSYLEARAVLTEILANRVRPELMAAFLIGQRMNIENDDEVLAYLDAILPPEEVIEVDTPSLTHFGQPFDGALRYFRPTLFVAAVRAALGRPTVLHGVDYMPPKGGITEEQLLKKLGARVDLSLVEGAELLQKIGLVYISQREYAPGAYALRTLREHIKKRPPWATTEKAQQLYRCKGRNCAVLGFYHIGYEGKLLDMMRARGYDAGLAIKGEEGTTHYALRLGKASDAERKAINYTEGFCAERAWAEDVQPRNFGIDYEQSPRAQEASTAAFTREGMAALAGEKGAAYDRIALSVGVADYYLGFCERAQEGVEQARRVLDDGRARRVLERYIEQSQQL
ncbi:MAG: anthranilate phosphoribosyltransferase [Candidatus Latescibacterota bacterium]|jgi:anthranilate phosphoribosyltransferase